MTDYCVDTKTLNVFPDIHAFVFLNMRGSICYTFDAFKLGFAYELSMYSFLWKGIPS